MNYKMKINVDVFKPLLKNSKHSLLVLFDYFIIIDVIIYLFYFIIYTIIIIIKIK